MRNPLVGIADIDEPNATSKRLITKAANEHLARWYWRQVGSAGTCIDDMIHGAKNKAAVVELSIGVAHAG